MGESTHEWTKKQKVSTTQITNANAVCEDCGRKWTATLAEVPVTIFIKDLDEYYKKLSKNLLEAVEPPMVLCVFRPSDRDMWDTEITLSCVAPRQDSPYHWHINHKNSGPAAASGCQIIPWRDKNFESKSEVNTTEPEIVTIKEENENEGDEEMIEVKTFDPYADDKNVDSNLHLGVDTQHPLQAKHCDTQIIGMTNNLRPPPLSAKGNTEVRKRFVKTSEENITAIKEIRFEKRTVKSTVWGIKIFKDWLKENDLDTTFESLPPSELDTLLARFYVEVRKVDGEYYTKPSYVGIKTAIQRHIQNPPWNITYSILRDSTFSHSNQVLSGVFKKLKQMGKSVVSHHKPIDPGDILKLIETGVIGTQYPKALLNLVWLSVALQFGKIGQDGFRSMTKDTFRRGTDDTGCEFYEYVVSESQKNHSGRSLASTNLPQGHMYARPGDPLCPVAAMDKYLSLLHHDLNCLWQKPNDRIHQYDSMWYCNIPLGINTLGRMMKMMCKDAGLSQIYTNHSIRVTASKALGDAMFDRSDIIKITGHRDIRSLDTYVGGTSSVKKKALSDTLSELTCHQGKSETNVVRQQIQLQDSPDYSVKQNKTSSDKIIMDIEENEMLVSGTSAFGIEKEEHVFNRIKSTDL